MSRRATSNTVDKAEKIEKLAKKAKTGKKHSKISERQKRLFALLGEVVESGEEVTRVELLRRVGYSERSIDGNTKKIWNAPGFRALCEAGGLGMGRIRDVIEEATKAKTVVTFQGEAHESEAPDHAIRLRAAEMLAKVSGLMVDRSESVNVHMDASEALDILNLG